MKIGRNDPCHCGSGQKYKKCCAPKDEAKESAALAAEAAARAATAEADAEEPATPTKGSAHRPELGATARPKPLIKQAANPIRRRAV